MIFGGYGRKAKHRGDVFFVCFDCEAINVFGLVENYGYGQLYGIRIAKYGTHRFLVCSHCQRGYELDKDQWNYASKVASVLAVQELLTIRQMAQSCVTLAEGLFPDEVPLITDAVSQQLETSSREDNMAGLLRPPTAPLAADSGTQDVTLPPSLAYLNPPRPPVPDFMSYLGSQAVDEDANSKESSPATGQTGAESEDEIDDHLPDAPVEGLADDAKACPDCAEIIRRAARVCRFCGYRFSPPPP